MLTQNIYKLQIGSPNKMLSFSLSRQISTQLFIPPPIVGKIYENAPASSFSEYLLDFQTVNKHQNTLKLLYQSDKDFKKFADNLHKVYNNPNVKSIAISFEKKLNQDDLEKKNPYYLSSLVATSLLLGVGLMPYYSSNQILTFAYINKDNISKIRGHQDSIFLKPDDEYLNLIPVLLFVNCYSQSNAKTWVKESADIVDEFKEKHPSSYAILKKVNFVSRSRNIDVIGVNAPHKIIDENDKINFVSDNEYLPSPIDIYDHGLLNEDVDLAILKFKEVVNSSKNRYEFVINNRGVQFLVVKNEDAVHGREEIEEEFMGKRLITLIPLQNKQPSSATKTTSIDAIKVDERQK